jgi:hypothetical protein
MNEREALEQARRLWGKEAHVRYCQGQLPQGAQPYAVGRWIGRNFQALGQGESWEEAFQAAESLLKNPVPPSVKPGG